MELPKLDDSVREEFSKIPLKEIPYDSSTYHELLFYGVDAIAHHYVMAKAEQMLTRKMTPRTLGRRLGVRYHDGNIERGLMVMLAPIQECGIYIPPQADLIDWTFNDAETAGRKIYLFGFDYINRFLYQDAKKTQMKHAEKIVKIHQCLSLKDLQSHEFIIAGKRFTQDMWQTVVEVFDRKREPGRLDDLGHEILMYYDKIIMQKIY